MVEDKPTTLLLPHVLRGISKQVPQRRTLDKLLLVAVTAAAIYGVSLAISSSLPSQQLVQNVIFRPSVAQAPSVPTVTSSTTPRAWRPGSTLAAQSGSNHSHFRQLSNSVVVVREGSDVQLDCRLTVKPHAIVTWYKAKNVFLTMGKRTYVDDDRIEVVVDEKSLNWALRIRNLKLEDANKYSCHLALAAEDLVTVTLDVLPRDEGATPVPAEQESPLSELFKEGFYELPSAEACPDQGAGITAVIAVATHPLYSSHRTGIRSSWGMVNHKKNMVVIFGMGSINSAIQSDISAENKKASDMVIGNYKDISIDINVQSFKQLSLLQWVTEHCARANFTLLVTHGEFVNSRKLQSVVAKLDPDQPTIHGRCDADTTVKRDPTLPTYLSYVSYQRPTLPRFCLDPAFLLSRAAVRPLYEQALRQRVLPLANILLTGLAAEAAGVARHTLPELYREGQNVQTCEYEGFVSGPTWGRAIDMEVWKRIVSNAKCSKGK